MRSSSTAKPLEQDYRDKLQKLILSNKKIEHVWEKGKKNLKLLDMKFFRPKTTLNSFQINQLQV